MKLHKKTLALIKKSKKSIPEIADETGVGKRWLYRMVKGDYSDPGVNKIEKIHDYLVESENLTSPPTS